jgi:hypothetical protein
MPACPSQTLKPPCDRGQAGALRGRAEEGEGQIPARYEVAALAPKRLPGIVAAELDSAAKARADPKADL